MISLLILPINPLSAQKSDQIRIDVGSPEVHKANFCIPLPSSGDFCEGFVAYEEFPIAVYSNEIMNITLKALNVPDGVFVKFVPEHLLNVGPDGASATMILAGAVKPFTEPIPDTKTMIIQAESSNGNSAGAPLLIIQTHNLTILHTAGPIWFPKSIEININGNIFGVFGVVYDPEGVSDRSLSVNLSILGLLKDGKILPLPSWLQMDIPTHSFSLNATEPFYFIIKANTSSAAVGTHTIAIDEIINGEHFTQNLQVTVIEPHCFGPGGPAHVIHLDKTEYRPGDTVVIKVQGYDSCAPSNRTVVMKIFYGSNDFKKTHVVYQETKQFINGFTEFEYKIPATPPSDNAYSYFVLTYDSENDIPLDKAVFFTKENASKIVISDFKIDDEVGPDGVANFEFKVSDGFGNTISGVQVSTGLWYQSCERGRNGLPSEILQIDDLTEIIKGRITMLEDFEPGIHNLYIYVNGETAVGYQPAKAQVTIEFPRNLTGIKIIDSKPVDMEFFVPPEPADRFTRINVDDYTINVESDNRICSYEFVPAAKRLTLHVSSTERQQFMKITIPKEVLSGEITVLINGHKTKFDLTENENSYVIAMNYVGCMLDPFVGCDIDVSGTKAIPEFPVNLMTITAIGLIAVLVALRLKINNGVLR